MILAAARDPQALLEQQIGAKRLTMMHMMVNGGNMEVVEILLSAATDRQCLLLQTFASARFGGGITSMHLAAAQAKTEVAKKLVELAPDPQALLEAVDAKGRTPFDMAMECGQADACRFMQT